VIRCRMSASLVVLSLTAITTAWLPTSLWSVDAPVDPAPAVVTSTNASPITPSPSTKLPLVLEPVLITVDAGQGGVISFKDAEPSKLLGGVRLGYEHILVLSDHIDYWQSLLPGVKRATLDHALIDQGPDSPEPGKVVFDSRASKLPQFGFRGIMQPAQVEIIRQPLNPEDKSHIVYRVLMHQVGAFSGDLQTTDGWASHAGWAEEIQCLVFADIMPGGPANPRFTEVKLLGRSASHPEGKRGARLERLKQAIPDPVAVKSLGAEYYDWWVQSSFITIVFDNQGRVESLKTGTDTTSGGTPSLDTPVKSSESLPKSSP
jgi:hypothetical protein